MTSVILKNIRLYVLTPVGDFFLLLPRGLPSLGRIPDGYGSVPLGFVLEGPSLFLRGLLSGDCLSPPVTDPVLIQTPTC